VQRQAYGVTEAAGERALGSQSSQVVCPWLGWKVSGGHALHSGVVRFSCLCANFSRLHLGAVLSVACSPGAAQKGGDMNVCA
jgi:hypothetical protein